MKLIVFVLLGLLSLAQPDGPPPVPAASHDSAASEMWTGIPRVATADPSIRHEEIVRIPTKLRVTSDKDGVSATFEDSCCWINAKVEVGYQMSLGFTMEQYYFDGPKRETICTSQAALPFQSGVSMSVRGIQSVANRRGIIQILADIVVFQTDVPSQHAWSPKSGRYEELWRGVATGELKARP